MNISYVRDFFKKHYFGDYSYRKNLCLILTWTIFSCFKIQVDWYNIIIEIRCNILIIVIFFIFHEFEEMGVALFRLKVLIFEFKIYLTQKQCNWNSFCVYMIVYSYLFCFLFFFFLQNNVQFVINYSSFLLYLLSPRR